MLLIPVFWLRNVLHGSCSSFVAWIVFRIRFVVRLTLQIQIHTEMSRLLISVVRLTIVLWLRVLIALLILVDRLLVVAGLVSIVLLHVVRCGNFGLSHLVSKVKLLVLDTLLSIWILLVGIILLVNRWLLILIWCLIVRLGNAALRRILVVR